MPLLLAPDTRPRFIAIKPLNNTLLSGTKTNTQHLVSLNCFLYLVLTINSGRFLSNHYREALKIVKDGTGQLKTIQDAHGISDDHFTRFLSAEKSYLQGLKAEPPEETLQFQYIEALDTLRQHRCVVQLHIQYLRSNIYCLTVLTGLMPKH